MLHGEGQCPGGRRGRFRGRSEEQIDIGRDSRRLEALQGRRRCPHVDPLVEGGQNPGIARLDAQLQHDAPRVPQFSAELGIREAGQNPGEPVPRRSGRVRGQRGEQRGAERIVQQMDQRRFRFADQDVEFRRDLLGRKREVWIPLGPLRAKGAAPPPAAAGGAVREDRPRRQVICR